MYRERRVALVIPALNEADALGPVLRAVDRELVDDLVVGDNGSEDGTAELARAAGATVVVEPRRGYGSACLRALAELRALPGDAIVVFMDGDGSDDPAEIPRVIEPIARGEVDVVIGSRVLGRADPGALTVPQRVGNQLMCALVRLFWGVRFTDLGPFRAVTRRALDALEMADPDFGWTIELQVKAVQRRLRVTEVPVSRRVRAGGTSKVSGNVVGAVRAAHRIMTYVLAAKMRDLTGARRRGSGRA